MVYSSNASSSFAWFTANLDGSNPTAIPLPSGLTNNNVWNVSTSANGKTVAMIGNGDIWVENADGSGAKQLTTLGNVGLAHISPDGKKIVYNSWSSTDHEWIINSDGTGNADLTPTPPTGTTECYSGSFSANSAMVVLVCWGNGNGYGIYTVGTNGTGMNTVTTSSNWVEFPFLTPDNKKVIYSGYLTTGSYTGDGVASVNIDGSALTVLQQGPTETLILNSNLYFANSCTGQLSKSNLDGTGAVQIGTSSVFYDLFYNGGC